MAMTNEVGERSLGSSDRYIEGVYFKCCSGLCNQNEWKTLCHYHYMRKPVDYGYYHNAV